MRSIPQTTVLSIRFPSSLLQQMREVRQKSGTRLPAIVRKSLNAVERGNVVVTPWRATTTSDDSMAIKVGVPDRFAGWPGWKIVAATNWHMQQINPVRFLAYDKAGRDLADALREPTPDEVLQRTKEERGL